MLKSLLIYHIATATTIDNANKPAPERRAEQKCSGEQAEVSICQQPACDEEECIDCVWGEWQEYTPCECEGLQERHRTVARLNNSCGKPCVGPRVVTKSCKPNCAHPPQDCTLGEWTIWSACDKDCDGGQRTRSREIISEVSAGGKGCDACLKETDKCNEQACFLPSNCKLSTWTEWSSCSASCGPGNQTRKREISELSKQNGKPCEAALSECRSCQVKECAHAVDCKWGSWGEWSACSQSCGGGDRSRSRLIEVAPRFGGKLCDPLAMSEVGPCAMQDCTKKRDCVFNPWSEWDACSCSCNGIRHRVRHIGVYPEFNGIPCEGALREVNACNVDRCHKAEPKKEATLDCKIGDWNGWSDCSKTCGESGMHKRYRSITQRPAGAGQECHESLEEIDACTAPQCPADEAPTEPPRDCKWSEWDQWGACSTSCGGGEKVRQRQITQMANETGQPCEDWPSMEVKSCNTGECGCADCEFATWSEWGACTCTGLQERHRAIKDSYADCGNPCEGPKVMTRSCKPDCLGTPTHCEFEEWSNWTDCTKTCGGGQRERTRIIAREATHGGLTCDGPQKEIDACGIAHCFQPKDCEMSEWEPWTACSRSCGGGQATRHRHITKNVENRGKACKASLAEVKPCAENLCAKVTNCQWGEWEQWGACTQTCGGGQRSRTRNIVVAPKSGGKLCDQQDKEEVEACGVEDCGIGCVNAKWDIWSSWSECTATCGPSYRNRYRTLLQSANYCGKAADGKNQEFEKCPNKPCGAAVIDCKLSDWSEFNSCSCSCNGIQERTRRVLSYPTNGGVACTAALKEIVPCNVEKCKLGHAVDCELGEWQPWTDCDHPCNGGTQTRARSIAVQPQFGGLPCEGSLKTIKMCNQHACPGIVDCQWGDWNEWGSCSVECGGGERNRYRHITQMAHNGGKPCATQPSTEVEACNIWECQSTSFCAWSGWESWTDCTTSCGAGETERRRYLQLSRTPPTPSVESQRLNEIANQGSLNEHTVESLGFVFCSGCLAMALLFTLFNFGMRRRSAMSRNMRSDDSMELLASGPGAE